MGASRSAAMRAVLVVAALLEQADQEAAREIAKTSALGAFPPCELDLPAAASGLDSVRRVRRSLQSPRWRACSRAGGPPRGAAGDPSRPTDRGRQQARRHLVVAQPVLMQAPGGSGRGTWTQGSPRWCGRRPPGHPGSGPGILEMAAEVVEAKLAVGGELPAWHRRGPGPTGQRELVLNQLPARGRESTTGDGESEGAEHSEERSRRSGSAPRHSEL